MWSLKLDHFLFLAKIIKFQQKQTFKITFDLLLFKKRDLFTFLHTKKIKRKKQPSTSW